MHDSPEPDPVPPGEGSPPEPLHAQPADPAAEAQVRGFVVEAARLLADRHCEDVRVLDVRSLTDVTDYVLIATGTSERQVASIAGELRDLAAERKLGCYNREADEVSRWLVLDFVDAVVHLFEPATRAHYDLEMLWGDASRVDWRREAGRGA